MKDLDMKETTLKQLAQRCDGPDQFQNFDEAFRHSLTIPKEALLKEETRQKKFRARRRAVKSYS